MSFSPSIMIEANKCFQENDFKRASDLCRQALSFMPNYNLANSILIKSLYKLGNTSEIKIIFNKPESLSLLRNNEIKQIYDEVMSEIEITLPAITHISIDMPQFKVNHNNLNIPQYDYFFDETEVVVNSEEKFEEEFFKAIRDDSLSDDLINNLADGEVTPEIEDDIITETLATIYEKQEAYQEAINIYKKLISLYPEKESGYQTKIKHLSIMLED